MDKKFICSICQVECEGFGNNAEPVNDGRCCTDCDNGVVIPARIRIVLRAKRKSEVEGK